jgi:hypothetical protein
VQARTASQKSATAKSDPKHPPERSTVATSSTATPRPANADSLENAIENEIPQYRAISRWSIFAFIFGLASPLSFAADGFLLAGLAAILCGLFALWAIKKFPDLYTGDTLAKAGIALGLVFTLSPKTIEFAQQMVLKRQAESFAGEYIKVLTSGDAGDAMWHRLPPKDRRSMTPADVLASLQKQAAENPALPQRMLGPIRTIQSVVKEGGGDIHLVRIERCGYFEVTPYAGILLKLEIPTAFLEDYKKKHPDWREPAKHSDDDVHPLINNGEKPSEMVVGQPDPNHDHQADPKDKPADEPTQVADKPSTPPADDRSPLIEEFLRAPEGSLDNLYILLDARAQTDGGQLKWWVNELIFPYRPNSAELQAIQKETKHGDHVH